MITRMIMSVHFIESHLLFHSFNKHLLDCSFIILSKAVSNLIFHYDQVCWWSQKKDL